MSAPTCTTCGRTLVSRPIWEKFTPAERARIYHSHARMGGRGLCQRDYAKDAVYGRLPEGGRDLSYRGGWVTRRLIQVPTAGRSTWTT